MKRGAGSPQAWWHAALALALWAAAQWVHAQVVGPATGTRPTASEPTVLQWLTRSQDALRARSFVGTYVVSSEGALLSSSRVWHVCDGVQQVERIEALSGTPRSTFRRNDEVMIFWPEQRRVVQERRDSLGAGAAQLLKSASPSLNEHYALRRVGWDRVAGLETDVVVLVPKDALRYGYRVWSERRTGLVMRVETLHADGRVLEQAGFMDMQLDAPVRQDKLLRMMAVPEGWQLDRNAPQRADAASEGWALRVPVPGFSPASCYKRSWSGAPDVAALQWVFTDGLASVSLFIEPYERQRHPQEGLMSLGATHSLTRRLAQWWITAVGEVPAETLKAFVVNLERRR